MVFFITCSLSRLDVYTSNTTRMPLNTPRDRKSLRCVRVTIAATQTQNDGRWQCHQIFLVVHIETYNDLLFLYFRLLFLVLQVLFEHHLWFFTMEIILWCKNVHYKKKNSVKRMENVLAAMLPSVLRFFHKTSVLSYPRLQDGMFSLLQTRNFCFFS